MKLFVFFTYGVSLDKWNETGILSREVSLYTELAKKGVKVTFVTYGDSDDERHLTGYKGIDVVPIYSLVRKSPNRYFRLIQSFFYTPFVLLPYAKEADIIKSKQIFGAWLPSIISRILKKPYILRTGYDYLDFFSRSNKSKFLKRLLIIIFRFSINSAAKIQVATKKDKDSMVNNFPNCRKKVDISPNWVDTERFFDLDVARYDNRILFVGRLTEQKNIPLLIDAIAGTEIQLDIVGDGELKENLINYALLRKSKVEFKGVVGNNDLANIYNKYKIFTLVSTHEGNPKTLMEAMACGMAVVGTNVIGIRQLINHNNNGILIEQVSSLIRSSILELFENKNLRTSLANNARKYIHDQYSLKSYVDKELKMYKGFLSSAK